MAEAKAGPLAFLTDNVISTTLADSYAAFSERRKALNLTNPGTVDNIAREIQKDVLCTNFMFQGLRADFLKIFSPAPLFRIQHGFQMGPNVPSPYNLMALYGTSRASAISTVSCSIFTMLTVHSQVLLQAGISSDGNAQCFANYRWAPKFTTKSQVQISDGQALVQLDNEYTGDDFSASVKAMNPSILDGSLTGIFIGSYLQTITPRVSLGAEGVWQRPALNARPETAISYFGRYKGDDWIASTQYLAQGVLNVSYWKQLTAQVEAGVDTQLQFAPGLGGNGGMFGNIRREGTTTIGAKYDFRASSFRAQVDSAGKIGCYLEKRVAPVVTMTFAGEIDQVKVQYCHAEFVTKLVVEPYADLNFTDSKHQRSDWPYRSRQCPKSSWKHLTRLRLRTLFLRHSDATRGTVR